MTLTEFLLARIAEDLEGAEAVRDAWLASPIIHEGDPDPSPQPWRLTGTKRGSEAIVVRFSRVLAECEAKRRIVSRREELFATLCDLALSYADHPDYQEDWRPAV